MSARPIANRAASWLVVSLVLVCGIAGTVQADPAIEAHGMHGNIVASVTGVLGGDCNDTDADIFPDHEEIQGNRKDDNCNGLADEAPNGDPSTDPSDSDGDGQSLASGDCDDTNFNVFAGAPEVAGNLIDDDCDGMADEDIDGNPSSDVLDHDQDGVTIGSDRIFFSGFE